MESYPCYATDWMHFVVLIRFTAKSELRTALLRLFLPNSSPPNFVVISWDSLLLWTLLFLWLSSLSCFSCPYLLFSHTLTLFLSFSFYRVHLGSAKLARINAFFTLFIAYISFGALGGQKSFHRYFSGMENFDSTDRVLSTFAFSFTNRLECHYCNQHYRMRLDVMRWLGLSKFARLRWPSLAVALLTTLWAIKALISCMCTLFISWLFVTKTQIFLDYCSVSDSSVWIVT